MALSRRKTTVAILRGIMGPYHGREDKFGALVGRSRSWVKKVSAGITPLSEDTARLLELETGVSLDWLLGPPENPPTTAQEQPFTAERFESARALRERGEVASSQTAIVLNGAIAVLAGIGYAAGDKGRVSLFKWRLQNFIQQCKEEFGYHAGVEKDVRARVDAAGLPSIVCSDGTMDVEKAIKELNEADLTKARRVTWGGQSVLLIDLPPD